MTDKNNKTIVLTANTSWYLWNLRRRLAMEIMDHGFRVVFVAPEDDYSDKLRAISDFTPITLSRTGTNPLKELATIRHIADVLEREAPSAVLSWTPKLNIYCGLISRFSRFRLIPNVSGLGTVFIGGGMLAGTVGILYRLAFARLNAVFFQNNEDWKLFADANWINNGAATVLPGSGVDLDRFQPTPPPENDKFLFLYGGRLRVDKGLPELVEACRQLRAEGRLFALRVYGHFDSGDRSFVSSEQIAAWGQEGLLEYCGASDHMEDVFHQSDCVILPSYYREGVPRILLEAAACARPAITTDSIGCRDAVKDGVNGLLCKPRDVPNLVATMKRMLDLPAARREKMGRAARRLAEVRFDENFVISEYLGAIHQADMH
jgi:glycosyltransferase involved in cell wall biosynthesis